MYKKRKSFKKRYRKGGKSMRSKGYGKKVKKLNQTRASRGGYQN